MKLLVNHENDIVVFLNRFYITDLDFKNRDQLEDYFRTIFLKLKKFYHMSIIGYYQISVYIDPNYGVILHLIKEELDYCDYFENQIDMKIMIHNDCHFLYHIVDYSLTNPKLLEKGTIYRVSDQLYFKIEKKLTDIELGTILENSEILYGEETEEIICYSKPIYLS